MSIKFEDLKVGMRLKLKDRINRNEVVTIRHIYTMNEIFVIYGTDYLFTVKHIDYIIEGIKVNKIIECISHRICLIGKGDIFMVNTEDTTFYYTSCGYRFEKEYFKEIYNSTQKDVNKINQLKSISITEMYNMLNKHYNIIFEVEDKRGNIVQTTSNTLIDVNDRYFIFNSEKCGFLMVEQKRIIAMWQIEEG